MLLLVKRKHFLYYEHKKRRGRTVQADEIRSCRVDKNAVSRLFPWCRKISQLQIPGRQAGQYFLFRVAVLDRPENGRAGSALS